MSKQIELPIGHWLKRADQALTESAFAPLRGQALTRNHWQVLNAVSGAFGGSPSLEAAMEPFGDDADLDTVVEDLCARGWVDRSSRTLTVAGVSAHRALSEQVQAIRRRAMDGIEPDRYLLVIETLLRMVENLQPSDAGVWERAEQSGRHPR